MTKTFEQLMDEVEKIVDQLQSDKLPLDQVVEQVERAYEIIVTLSDKLQTASLKVENVRGHLRSKLEEGNSV